MDLYKGKQIKINITRRRVKYPAGINTDNALIECKYCKGHGIVMEQVNIAFGIMRQTQQPCTKCQGKGNYMRKGIKIYKTNKIIRIKIRAGSKHGDKIRFPGESDEQPGKPPADLIFLINELPHESFKRMENHLVTSTNITIWQALLGDPINVTFLDGSILHVKSNDIITPNKIYCVQGKGMVSYGNLYINFQISFPKQLSLDEKVLLEKKFGTDNTTDSDKIYEIKQSTLPQMQRQENFQQVGCAQQ